MTTPSGMNFRSRFLQNRGRGETSSEMVVWDIYFAEMFPCFLDASLGASIPRRCREKSAWTFVREDGVYLSSLQVLTPDAGLKINRTINRSIETYQPTTQPINHSNQSTNQSPTNQPTNHSFMMERNSTTQTPPTKPARPIHLISLERFQFRRTPGR